MPLMDSSVSGPTSLANVRSGQHRSILHVDMDAFFVSVELRRRPELVGQPVVVGGTGSRGVVAAASYEARRFGVYSAMPSAVAKRRCPHAVFLPGDHSLYGQVSAEVRDIFERYTPLVEPLSLDEAFLDVSGSMRLFGPAPRIAAAIRGDVRRELQLHCSVGVATNKFLAKLASVEAKPRATPASIEPGPGVVVVEPGQERAFLDPLPVQRLWGVGPVTLEKLHRIGIHRVSDFAVVPERALVAALGVGQAHHLMALARGDDDRAVEPEREAKSIGHEETYAENLTDAAGVRTQFVRLADAVATRLRQAGLGARTLTLKVRFDKGFHTITRSTTSTDAVDETQVIVALLQPIIDRLDPSPGIRLLGVSASNLGEIHRQLSFDELIEGGQRGSTQGALDAIRQRYGSHAIGPASAVGPRGVRNVERGGQQWGPDTERSPRSGAG